jgi:cytochrome P450
MQVLSLSFAALACYILGLCVYRLYFSRIAHIPGPKLAALTRFYEFYHDLWPHHGRFMFKCGELHQKYGPIIRIGPDEVHISDPDFYGEVYASHPRKRDKSTLWFWMVGSGEFLDNAAFATISHDVHRMRRSALNPFFSKQKVQELEPVVKQSVLKLRQRLLQGADTGALINLYDATSGLTLGAIPLLTRFSPPDLCLQMSSHSIASEAPSALWTERTWPSQ